MQINNYNNSYKSGCAFILDDFVDPNQKDKSKQFKETVSWDFQPLVFS
jgi:hypothetical protein